MYVAVQRIGNQWFRKDNGALVGTEITTIASFHKYHNVMIETETRDFLSAIIGYTDNNNQFIPLCIGTCFTKDCKMYNTKICMHAHQIEPTKGYYVILPG